jgi:RNA polymerase sigma-70 factor, ECF subfamily
MDWKLKSTSDENVVDLNYLDALYGYAMILTRNSSEAVNLVEATYDTALGPRESLRPSANMKNCLFSTLRNIWTNQLTTTESTADFAYKRAVNTTEHPRQNERVREAIQRLPLRLREVIFLRECELSYEEIACLLNCTVEMVRQRVLQARTELRGMLKIKMGTWNFLRRWSRFQTILLVKW